MPQKKKLAQVFVKAPCPEQMVRVRVTPPDSLLDVNISADGDSLEVRILPRGRQIQVQIGPDESVESDQEADSPSHASPPPGPPGGGGGPSATPPVKAASTLAGVELPDANVDLSALDAGDSTFAQAVTHSPQAPASPRGAPARDPRESALPLFGAGSPPVTAGSMDPARPEEDSSFPLATAPVVEPAPSFPGSPSASSSLGDTLETPPLPSISEIAVETVALALEDSSAPAPGLFASPPPKIEPPNPNPAPEGPAAPLASATSGPAAPLAERPTPENAFAGRAEDSAVALAKKGDGKEASARAESLGHGDSRVNLAKPAASDQGPAPMAVLAVETPAEDPPEAPAEIVLSPEKPASQNAAAPKTAETPKAINTPEIPEGPEIPEATKIPEGPAADAAPLAAGSPDYVISLEDGAGDSPASDDERAENSRLADKILSELQIDSQADLEEVAEADGLTESGAGFALPLGPQAPPVSLVEIPENPEPSSIPNLNVDGRENPWGQNPVAEAMASLAELEEENRQRENAVPPAAESSLAGHEIRLEDYPQEELEELDELDFDAPYDSLGIKSGDDQKAEAGDAVSAPSANPDAQEGDDLASLDAPPLTLAESTLTLSDALADDAAESPLSAEPPFMGADLDSLDDARPLADEPGPEEREVYLDDAPSPEAEESLDGAASPEMEESLDDAPSPEAEESLDGAASPEMEESLDGAASPAGGDSLGNAAPFVAGGLLGEAEGAAERSDFLESNEDYVGVGAEDEETAENGQMGVVEIPPFEKAGGKANIQVPYAVPGGKGKFQPETSTAVIVNYPEDRDDSLIAAQGESMELNADEDLDLDLLELSNAPLFRARPLLPVPKESR